MKRKPTLLLAIPALLLSAQALAEITFYEGEDFRGRAVTTTRQLSDFRHSDINDHASSVIVNEGRWEVCEDANFRGRCVMLREGNYDSLKRMGLNNRLSSARRISNSKNYDGYYSPEPLQSADYEYRRRPNERVHEARITSVRAVMGRPEERCWVDREVVEKRDNPNLVGGVIGGVIGGILGHQIGSGRGNDVATAGGAIAGAAIGANAGRGRDDYSRDVRRCETTQSGQPDYWDVRYTYRNVEHRVQMSAPPGRTIYVNNKGEPRQ